MPAPRVSIRLGTDGKAQVQRDFVDIGDTGDAQAQRIGASYERAANDADAALARLQKASERMASVAPPAAGAPTNSVNPITGAGYDESLSSARTSASAMTAQMAQQEQAAQRLLAATDPLYAAQMRYNQSLQQAVELQQLGMLSDEQLAKVQTGLTAAYNEQVGMLGKNGLATNQNRIAQMELEHAVRGSMDAFAAGMPPAQIFAMHLGMLAQAAQISGGSMGKVGEFLSGPWGIALTVAVMALGPLATKLLETGSATDALVDKLKKEAQQARDNDVAHQIFAQTLDGVTDATRRNEDALKKLGDQHQSAAQQALAHALAQIQLAKTIRDTTAAQLDGAQATLTVMRAQLSGPGHEAEVAAFGIQQQEAQVKALQETLGATSDEIQKNQADVLEAMSRLSVEAIDKMAEPVNRIKSKYGALIEQARQHAQQLANAARAAGDEAKAQALVTTELEKQLAPIKAKEDADIKAAQDRGRKGPANAGGTAIFDAQIASFFDTASKYRGDSETRDKGVLEAFFKEANLKLDPEKTAWCAAFVNAVLAAGGVHGTGSLAAKSFLTFGKDDTHSPQRGDIAVVRSGAGDHVGFVDSVDKAGNVRMLAGNTSNKVAEATYSKNQVLAIRRPPTPSEDAASQQKLADHAAELQREAEATENDTKASLALANAYLTSGSAAAIVAASRESVAKATRQQTDAEAAAARQLALDVAKGAADGAKHVAQLRDETAARTTVAAEVANGTVKAKDMGRALQDEAALRPLLALQAVAQGAAYTTLTAVIVAYRKALADAHSEEDRSQAVQRIAELGEQHAETMKLLSAELQLAAVPEQRRQEAVKLLEYELQLRRDLVGATDDEIHALVANAAAEDALRQHLERVTAAYDDLRHTGEQAIDTLFNIDNWKKPLDMALQLVKQIEQEFVTLGFANPIKDKLFGENLPTLGDVGGPGGFLKGLVGGGKAAPGGSAAAAGLSAAGTTLNTASAALTSAGTLWQGIAVQLQAAAAQLAAAGATGGGAGGGGLGGIGGILGMLGGGGAGAGVTNLDIGSFADNLSNAAAPLIDVPAFASGTESAPGGLSWVGEFGKELVRLPRGAKVYPANESRRMAAGDAANSNTPAGDTYHVNVTVAGGDSSSPAQDRRTGMQIGGGIAQRLAMRSRKGLMGSGG